MSDEHNREKILNTLRENSQKEGTMENFLYTLLGAADENFKSSYESLLVNAYVAAEQTAKTLMSADSDPALRTKLEEALLKASTSVSGKESEPDQSDS